MGDGGEADFLEGGGPAAPALQSAPGALHSLMSLRQGAAQAVAPTAASGAPAAPGNWHLPGAGASAGNTSWAGGNGNGKGGGNGGGNGKGALHEQHEFAEDSRFTAVLIAAGAIKALPPQPEYCI